MSGNRAQRRAMGANAEALADRMVSKIFDFECGTLVSVTDPLAVGALRRAFRLMLRAEGEPVAIPLSPAEANGFPMHKARQLR